MNAQQTVLLLAGDGDLRSSFEKQAAQLGLADRVRFVGWVSQERLPAYYAAANVVALPSLLESFGIVLIEAMACGTPVVASNLPGVRAVVTDGETGLLAEPGDAADLAEKLDRLLSDPPLRQRMGQAGRRCVEERYDWRAIGHRLEALYYQVLDGRHAGQHQRP